MALTFSPIKFSKHPRSSYSFCYSRLGECRFAGIEPTKLPRCARLRHKSPQACSRLRSLKTPPEFCRSRSLLPSHSSFSDLTYPEKFSGYVAVLISGNAIQSASSRSNLNGPFFYAFRASVCLRQNRYEKLPSAHRQKPSASAAVAIPPPTGNPAFAVSSRAIRTLKIPSAIGSVVINIKACTSR
jgi:hypothetical protein